MITAITATGDRPEAFALCRRWMAAQTVKPYQWIIVDDGQIPLRFPFRGEDAVEGVKRIEYIRREPQPDDPPCTLGVNLRAALSHIPGQGVFKTGFHDIVFFEDDEYYAPKYIQVMTEQLLRFSIVGVGCSKYYHLPTRKFHKHRNFDHASLAQTVFDASLLELFASCINGSAFIDVRLWKEAGIRKIGHIFDDDSTFGSLYCGIKGLPGRKGAGVGHNPDIDCYAPDPGLDVFKQWVPDHEAYQSFC